MKLDVLAIVAHPDDAELGAGGLLCKLVKQGKSVGIIDLTEGELGSRGTIHTRYDEANTAGKIIGITARENLKLGDGFFEETQENLIKIIEKIRKYQPEVIITNSITDRHPDHGRASKLVSRASYLSGLVKIETLDNDNLQDKHRPRTVYHLIQDRYIKPDFVVDITNEIDQKLEAVVAYKTQFFNPESKEPDTPISGKDFLDFIKSRAVEMGRPSGFSFAEGYTVERTIGVTDIFDLI